VVELATKNPELWSRVSQVPGRRIAQSVLPLALKGTRAASRALAFAGFGQDLIDEHRMSNRSSIVMAAVTIGALAMSAAIAIGAFVVVDNRAAQMLQSGPRIVPAEKKAAPPVRASRTAAGSRAAPASASRSPAPTQVQTVGSAAGAAGPPTASRTASTRAAGAPTVSRQANTGEPAPDTTLDNRNKRRTEARHGRRHGRDMARSSPEQQDSSAATSAAQGAQGGGQSALFFPFR
jgi:hypothetical protein